MQDYNLTEIIEVLDKVVLYRATIEERVIAEKLYDDGVKLWNELGASLLQFNCQIIDKNCERMELEELKEI